MRKILCAFLKVTLGLTFICGVAGASTPVAHRAAGTVALLDLSGTQDRSFLQNLPDLPPTALRGEAPNRADSDLDIMQVVYRLSYVGAVVLTADRVVRSVDSVLDRMQINCTDGTNVRFTMEPGRRGFDVMVKVSRPLEF